MILNFLVAAGKTQKFPEGFSVFQTKYCYKKSRKTIKQLTCHFISAKM